MHPDEKMKVEIQTDSWNQFLKCPHCAETGMHHYEAQIFTDSRDGSSRVVVTTDEADTFRPSGKPFSVKVDQDVKDNPAHERQGMRILFWCEICDSRSVLEVIQAKGATELVFKPLQGDCLMGIYAKD